MTAVLKHLKRAVKSHGFLYAHAAALRSLRPIPNVLSLRRNLLFARVMTRTLVAYDRLLNTYELARRVERDHLLGAYVECGVWRGGVSALLALLARKEGRGRLTHLFDSFRGLPTPTVHDGGALAVTDLAPVGLYVATREDVQHFLFEELRLGRGHVLLHEGWFQHTLPVLREVVHPIALLRIDADWYESVKTCLESLYANVVEGGYVILDDYGSYPGCRRAFEEFREARGIEVALQPIDRDGVWFQKPRAAVA
jgi:O-methyltransferase